MEEQHGVDTPTGHDAVPTVPSTVPVPAAPPIRDSALARDSDATRTADPARTGDPEVDAALAHLEDLADRPVREHVAVFEAVHGALADRLAESRD